MFVRRGAAARRALWLRRRAEAIVGDGMCRGQMAERVRVEGGLKGSESWLGENIGGAASHQIGSTDDRTDACRYVPRDCVTAPVLVSSPDIGLVGNGGGTGSGIHWSWNWH